jgi:olefin beta-lactone synthetase
MSVNIAETFMATARRYGQRTAIIEAQSGRSISFSQLEERSCRFATFFQQEGVKPGEIVMLMVKPSIDFICLTLALFKIGAPVVLIDPGMGYRNLLRCIDKVEPRYLVGVPAAILFSRVFLKPFATVIRRFCCGPSLGILGRNILVLPETPFGGEQTYAADAADLAAIIFTTGSTGPPKGVRYEHRIFAAQLALVKEAYGIDSRGIDQPAFPLFALFSAAAGACAVIPDMDASRPATVNPLTFVASIRRYKVTYSFGSPAIWNVVSRYCLAAGITLESVKKVLMAGAPVPYELLQRVRAILPEHAEIFTPYGATESLPIVSIESREILDETCQLSRAGAGTCVGRPLAGIDLAIIKISDQPIPRLSEITRLKPGERGEIIVSGAVVTRAYHNNPQATALAKIWEGEKLWHRMGDIGYLDDHGRLWFCGRVAHRVITPQGTMLPIPCEAIINEHPEVSRSALVGIPSSAEPNFAEPVIVLEMHEKTGFDRGQILKEVRLLADRSPLTKDINHFLFHPAFPVDIRHNAKIFREKLAIWAQQQIKP